MVDGGSPKLDGDMNVNLVVLLFVESNYLAL